MRNSLKKTTLTNLKNKLLRTGWLLLTPLLLISCNDDDDSSEPIEVAYVSLYQASPDTPALDIMVDGRQINFYPFDYTDYTGYLRFYTGDRKLSFSPVNANNVIADTVITFESNSAYSVFTADDYADLKVLVLEDESDSPSDGNAMIRFINLSPDALHLDLLNEGDELLFDDQEFMETASFEEITADNHDLMVNFSDDDSRALQVPDITFYDGLFYTVLVRGYETPPAGNDHVLSAQILVN